MKKFKQLETRLLLFLISGILLLSIGFVSCGTGPQTKTTVANKGAYAVDFGAAPSELGFIDLGKSIDSMAGLTEFTIEAWVKPNTTTSGGIFARGSGDPSAGIELYISDNTPKFTMTSGGSVTATAPLTNEWTHIAVVLANANHTLVHNECSGGSYRDDIPHLDIYINGTFNNCASASYPQAFSYNERIGRPHNANSVDFETLGARLDALIDEVRFWKVARTASQIQTWMNEEITETNWNQANPNNALIGYWRLNEGAGTAIYDASGTGNGGTKYYCQLGSGCATGGTSILWYGGWVAGYLF